MGAGPGVRDLGHRPGLGPARARRARAGRRRRRSRRARHGPGRRVLVVLLRGDRDRQEPVPEGGVGRRRPGLPVRLDEPRLGAGPGAVGAHRLAVHPRRVPRRPRDDRSHVDAAARLRLAPRRGGRARARAARRRRSPARRGEHEPALARAADLGRRLVRRGPQLPRRLADAVEGDLLRLPAGGLHRAAGRRLLQRPLPRRRPGGRPDAVGRAHRPRHRRAELRVLGGQRPAGRRAVVRRPELRRRDGLHLRRPDRAADPARLPQVLRHRASRCGSPRSCT